MADTKNLFFIEYANAFFDTDPLEKLRDAFAHTDGERLEPLLFAKGLLSINALRDFLKQVNYDNLQSYLEKRPKNALYSSWNQLTDKMSSYDQFKAVFERTALDTAFAYREGYCEIRCPHRKLRGELFLDRVSGGKHTLLCHECDAYQIVWVLYALVDRWDFAQIKRFDELISQAKYLERRLATEGRKISETFVFTPTDPMKSLDTHGGAQNALKAGYYPDFARINDLREFITACVSFSLVEFLTDPNASVDWIKCCKNCERFFVAKHKKRELCHKPDCDRSYKNEYIKRKRSEHPLYSQRVY